MMISLVLAIRVVAPFRSRCLRIGFSGRHRCDRPADYRRAVRFSWLALGVVARSGHPCVGHSWLGIPGGRFLSHLVTMLFLGRYLVELCRVRFRKVPFTCSYLPGKANIHFAFWAFLLFYHPFSQGRSEPGEPHVESSLQLHPYDSPTSHCDGRSPVAQSGSYESF